MSNFHSHAAFKYFVSKQRVFEAIGGPGLKVGVDRRVFEVSPPEEEARGRNPDLQPAAPWRIAGRTGLRTQIQPLVDFINNTVAS